jgi:hypothetical protein
VKLRLLAILAALGASAAHAQNVKGSLTANGKTAELRHALAQEVDSATEKGYMDVIVVLSDRKLSPADARNTERLETMARKDGLVALVVKLDPDAKVMSAEPLHPAFTTFVASAAFVRWKPSAYDEKRVAGRFWTEGVQKEFRQEWSYDVTFSAPITLDPGATTVPRK